MVKIRNFSDAFVAGFAKEILESETIPVLLKTDGRGTAWGEGYPPMHAVYEVFVDEESAEKATEILKAYLGEE
ncbi:MAG: DUF2007 domain-containing protein [Ignavibacteriae bacterium]|nr:DUF2007 domain-containing protein [Ignavibacteriota bacterium]